MRNLRQQISKNMLSLRPTLCLWTIYNVGKELFLWVFIHFYLKFLPENDYNVDVIERLLSGGAKLDARTAWGDTAVHYAGDYIDSIFRGIGFFWQISMFLQRYGAFFRLEGVFNCTVHTLKPGKKSVILGERLSMNDINVRPTGNNLGTTRHYIKPNDTI